MSVHQIENTVADAGVGQGSVENLGPGAQVAGYTIIETVASGGFATVHRARSIRTGEYVALKILHPDLIPAGTPAKRFLLEAQALAKLVHPSIVRVIEVGEVMPSLPFIAMEWVEGRMLFDVLRSHGAFSADEFFGFMEHLGAALSVAHAAGIVHRDIKPSNVMLVPQGDWYEVKLLDFGIAKLLDAEPQGALAGLTATGIMIGTPSFMAPEQLLCQPVDARTDIYALGILGFALLTGRHPFAGHGAEMAEMHLTAIPPRVSDIVNVPPGVDEAIRVCLEKRPTNRFPSVEAFVEALRRAVRAAPASEMHPSTSLFMAVHVMASWSGSDENMNEDALANIDGCLERALEVLARAGMNVTLSTGNAFVATREVKVTSPARAQKERAANVELVFSLLDEMTALLGSTPDVSYSLAMNVVDDRARLHETRWMTNNPWNAVVATREALMGIEDLYVLQAIAGAPERWSVARRAGSSLTGGELA